MAANDYSHRQKKDVFIDNDNQDAPQSGQPQHNASSDIDIDGIIEKHRTDIHVLKVSIIIIAIVILVLVGMFAVSGDKPKEIWKKIILLICMITPALVLSMICGDFIYKMFLKRVVRSIDAITYYKLRRRKPKALKKILTFDVPIYSSRNENVTMIEIGDTTVTASHFSYSQNKGRHRIVTICQGDCYAVDIKNKLIPNGIWLVRNLKNIKKGKYSSKSNGSMIYADTAEAIQNCNKADICAISEKIYNANHTSFALYFENNIMYYIELNHNDEGFYMDVFDFNIEKYLRRDLAILNNRIRFAEILAST